jgi:hypothetical protein
MNTDLLFRVRSRNESGAVLVEAGFPNDHDLIDRYVAALAVVIPQVQHTRFDFQNLTTQTRRSTTVDVKSLANHSR